MEEERKKGRLDAKSDSTDRTETVFCLCLVEEKRREGRECMTKQRNKNA